MDKLLKYLGLIFAFIFVAIIKSSPLEEKQTFILAALIIFSIIYIVIQRRNASFNLLFSGRAPEIFFISSIVLFMVEITGGPSSPLYFLNYFLLFGLPLISAPLMSLIFSISLISFYTPEFIRGIDADTAIKIGSIVLLLPLSYFLAREIKHALLPESEKAPAAAIRATYVTLLGVDDMNMNAFGIDVMASKNLSRFTPYLGMRKILATGTETTSKVDLERESIWATQGVIGVMYSIWKFNIAAEYGIAEVSTFAIMTGVNF